MGLGGRLVGSGGFYRYRAPTPGCKRGDIVYLVYSGPCEHSGGTGSGAMDRVRRKQLNKYQTYQVLTRNIGFEVDPVRAYKVGGLEWRTAA